MITPGRAAVDAQRAAGADVVVDDEHDLVGRVLAGLLGAGRLDDRLRLTMWMHFHGQMSTQPSHMMHSVWSMWMNCFGLTAFVR